jgi:hypothetical protein
VSSATAPVPAFAERRVCDNCGSDDEELDPVRRVYVLPEPKTLDEVEWWCVSCQTQYPHVDA